MDRQTIDFGIDLGTTNSAVAVRRGADTEIWKNNEQDEITPSAVFVEKNGELFVGRAAKEKLEFEPENAQAEFKKSMGTDKLLELKRTKRAWKPEELSAEVLKELAGSVRQKGEELTAAVITIPAAFDQAQCAATGRAAALAGIDQHPLLQEPVAAALAYGFQQDTQRARWFVFDLGGGTFDAAVIQVRDGMVQVLNHGGDNHLGGSLVDWDIVNKIFAPELERRYVLGDFVRPREGQAKWRTTFARLKSAAEKAKIDLSRRARVRVFNDALGRDDAGGDIVLEINLERAQLEALLEPYIDRAVTICRRVLSEKRLTPADIEKVLLVGGPTLTPYLRERLADPRTGLGIPLEVSVDPLTVVARGAAVFAGTQRRERTAPAAAPARGAYSLHLEYKPVGPDRDPDVAGKVVLSGGQSIEGFTIEFVRAGTKETARTGRIPIGADGTFFATLMAEKGVENVFLIELVDAVGRRQPTEPDRLSYTMGLVFSEPPLPHTVGIAQYDNTVDQIFKRGIPLPARAKKIHQQMIPVRKGEQLGIRIPLVEGESKWADGNNLWGALSLPGSQVRRDVPAGTEVEITIQVDESRNITATAYVPLLDQEFAVEVSAIKTGRPIEVLSREVEAQQRRLEEMREEAADVPDVGEALEDLAPDEAELEAALDAADEDSPRCEDRLAQLRGRLNDLEARLGPTRQRRAAEHALEWAGKGVETWGDADEKQRLLRLRADVQQAVETKDGALLEQLTEAAWALGRRVWHRRAEFWVGQFEWLGSLRGRFTDAALADRYLAQGHRALQANDLDALKAASRQLIALLPAGEEDRNRGFGGTTMGKA